MRPSSFGVTAALLVALSTTAAMADELRLQWYGQSAVQIATPGGKTLLIDPFITANPVTPDAQKDLAAIGEVDLILVTHAHGDHWGDTARLSEMTEAPVAVNADFGTTLGTLGLVPADRLIRFNKSGPIRPIGEGITVTMTRAEHSSEFTHEDAGGNATVHPGGEPAGYIVELENGYTIWHMGDTGVFADMEWIARYYEPDLILMPIGGHFTMGPEHAAYATERFIREGTVIPIHYGTFPPLTGTPDAFESALGDTEAEVVVMEPGEERTFD